MSNPRHFRCPGKLRKLSLMNDTTTAKEHVLAEAERINQERMRVVEDLAEAVAHRVDLEHQVQEAQKREKKLMADAEKAGWTRKQVAAFARVPKRPGAKGAGSKAGSGDESRESLTDISDGTAAQH